MAASEFLAGEELEGTSGLAVMTVDAELCARMATARVVRYRFEAPSDTYYRNDDQYRLDLSVTPRSNASVCFPDCWSPHRFEPARGTILVPAGATIHAKNDCGHQTSIVCLMDSVAVREWFEGDLQWDARRLEACIDITSPRVGPLLSRLSEEVLNPGFACQTMVELIAAQLAIELRRYCAIISEGPASGGLSPWRLRLIDERLNGAANAPSLEELAKACGMSIRQLTRGYRASRGCSIGDSIVQSRLAYARRLLQTDACVKAIAHSLGFASPSSFTYAFRRATGTSPSKFRQSARRWNADAQLSGEQLRALG